MNKTNEILFIADPWDTLDHAQDSTLLLAKAATHMGITPYWTTPEEMAFSTDGPCALVKRISPNQTSLDTHSSERDLRSFDSLHWRVDPPVTLSTLRLWSLLDATLPPNAVFNSARSLLLWNEKYSALRFRDWSLPTLFSESRPLRERFIRTVLSRGKQVIVKPAAEAASRGVEILPPDLRRARERLNEIDSGIGPWPVLQEVDEGIHNGEMRLFILQGKVAGSLRKLPPAGSLIMDWDGKQKPTVMPAPPSEEQRQRATMIGKELTKAGVLFATIDFIGDRILEINVTSPGLLHRLGEAESMIFARWYWDFVTGS